MKTKARELKTRMTLMGVQVRDTVCRKGIVKTAKDGLARFAREEDGMGTVEIILIIVVLIGLVLIFKNQMTSIVNSLFQKISSRTSQF